jgi:hypothetical protein
LSLQWVITAIMAKESSDIHSKMGDAPAKAGTSKNGEAPMLHSPDD